MKIMQAYAAEYDQIVGLFQRYDFALTRRRWFDWKHLENPHGRSLVFKLLAGEDLDGTVAALPQIYRYRDRELTVLQAVDGLMGSRIRGRGLFNQVMEFIVRAEPENSGRDHFHTGFAMLPGSQKALENAGWHKLAPFRIRTCILSARKFRRLSGGRALAIVLKPVWALFRRLIFASASADVEILPVDRFEEDMSRFQPSSRIAGDRSAAWLNWRVCDNPRDDMRAFLVRDRNQTAGYIVCKALPGSWEVLEFRLSQEHRKYMASFLKYLYRNRLTDAVDFWHLEGFEQSDQLPRWGLITRRSTSAMFVYGLEEAGLPTDPGQWAAGYLDSDW